MYSEENTNLDRTNKGRDDFYFEQKKVESSFRQFSSCHYLDFVAD